MPAQPRNMPERIQAALPIDVEIRLGALIAIDERICQGARHHSPTPLLLHEVTLPDGRIVLLCGVCRDSVSVLELLGASDPKTSWALLRCFGNRVRVLVTGTR